MLIPAYATFEKTQLLEFIENVTQAVSVEEVWTELSEKMNGFGFDRLIYGFTRYKSKNGFGDVQDILLMTTQTPEYINGFINTGFYTRAPMVRWAKKNTGACSWRWIEENVQIFTKDELEVLEFNKKMNVTAGYTIAFPENSGRTKGGIALTAVKGVKQWEVDEIWNEHGRDIMAMNQVAHLAMVSLPKINENRILTKRQREVLQWVGDGKTNQDIALLMGLTPATVEKHLRLARESLDAETTAQAVLKASVFNQIYTLKL